MERKQLLARGEKLRKGTGGKEMVAITALKEAAMGPEGGIKLWGGGEPRDFKGKPANSLHGQWPGRAAEVAGLKPMPGQA